MILSQIAFALGACGGLARILMPSAVSTASKELVNWPARSLIRNLTEAARWPRSIRKLRAACVVHAPSGVRGDAGQVSPAGAVLDHDQRVDAPQQHGVHVDEVDGDDAAGLRGQELLPGRAGAAGRGIDPGIMQDLPDRGGGDRVAEPDQLALHPPVPPRGVLRRDADHELADRGCRGRPPRTPAARVVPLARDQPTVPGEQRRRCHREHLAPPAAGNQSRQRREPQPVGWLVTDPADLAAQHRVLVPQHQELGVLGHLAPGQHRQAAQQAANKQVDDRNDHSAMIPAGKSDQARSSNRAPQGLAGDGDVLGEHVGGHP